MKNITEFLNESILNRIFNFGKSPSDAAKILQGLLHEYGTEVLHMGYHRAPYLGGDKIGIYVTDRSIEAHSFNKLFDNVSPLKRVKSNGETKLYYVFGDLTHKMSNSEYKKFVDEILGSKLVRAIKHGLSDSHYLKQLEKEKAEQAAKDLAKKAEEDRKNAEKWERKRKEAEWDRKHSPSHVHGGDDSYGSGHSSWDDGNR